MSAKPPTAFTALQVEAIAPDVAAQSGVQAPPSARPIRRAFAGTLLAEVAILSLGAATGPIVARLLHPEGRGALAAVLFWPTLLAGIGLFSLGEATAYRTGQSPAREAAIAAAALRMACLMALLTVAAVVLLLPLLLGPQRLYLFKITAIYALVFIPANFITLSLIGADHGAMRFTLYNLGRLSVPAIYLFGLLALWAAGRFSVAWVAGINCVATVALAVAELGHHKRNIFNPAASAEAKELLRLALRFHPASLLIFLAAQADQFVVLSLWNNEVVGRYMVALTVASSGLAIVSGAFQKVLFPNLARAASGSQMWLFARGVRHATLLVAVLSLLLLISIPWALPLLFGPAFRSSIGPALALTLAYIFIAIRNLLIFGLRGMGAGKPGALASAIALVLFLASAWPAGRGLGLYGIALALGLSNLAACFYLLAHLKWAYGISLRSLWGVDRATAAELWNSVLGLTPFAARAFGRRG